MQFVEPRAQRHPLPVRGQRSAHLTRVWIDEHGARVVGRYIIDGQAYLRGVVGFDRWPDALDSAFGMCCAGRGELVGERQPLLPDVVDRQLVAVHHVVDLRDERIQQPGDGCDQDERAHEHAGVEMQPDQQRADGVRFDGWGFCA